MRMVRIEEEREGGKGSREGRYGGTAARRLLSIIISDRLVCYPQPSRTDSARVRWTSAAAFVMGRNEVYTSALLQAATAICGLR